MDHDLGHGEQRRRIPDRFHLGRRPDTVPGPEHPDDLRQRTAGHGIGGKRRRERGRFALLSGRRLHGRERALLLGCGGFLGGRRRTDRRVRHHQHHHQQQHGAEQHPGRQRVRSGRQPVAGSHQQQPDLRLLQRQMGRHHRGRRQRGRDRLQCHHPVGSGLRRQRSR